jgi:hypothetical protein
MPASSETIGWRCAMLRVMMRVLLKHDLRKATDLADKCLTEKNQAASRQAAKSGGLPEAKGLIPSHRLAPRIMVACAEIRRGDTEAERLDAFLPM